MDAPFITKIKIVIKTIQGATGSLWVMDHDCRSWKEKMLCWLAYVFFISLFTFVICAGDPTKFTQPLFVLYTALVIISVQWPYIWKLHKNDIRQYGYIRRTGQKK